VVSWKLAAEMNRIGRERGLVYRGEADGPLRAAASAKTLSFSSRKRNLSTCFSRRNVVSPTVLDLDPTHHLARDRLDVLVVDVDALEAVNLLNGIDQVRLRELLAEDGEQVVQVERAIDEASPALT